MISSGDGQHSVSFLDVLRTPYRFLRGYLKWHKAKCPSTVDIILSDISRGEATREFDFSVALWEISVSLSQVAPTVTSDSRSGKSNFEAHTLFHKIPGARYAKILCVQSRLYVVPWTRERNLVPESSTCQNTRWAELRRSQSQGLAHARTIGAPLAY